MPIDGFIQVQPDPKCISAGHAIGDFSEHTRRPIPADSHLDADRQKYWTENTHAGVGDIQDGYVSPLQRQRVEDLEGRSLGSGGSTVTASLWIWHRYDHALNGALRRKTMSLFWFQNKMDLIS